VFFVSIGWIVNRANWTFIVAREEMSVLMLSRVFDNEIKEDLGGREMKLL